MKTIVTTARLSLEWRPSKERFGPIEELFLSDLKAPVGSCGWDGLVPKGNQFTYKAYVDLPGYRNKTFPNKETKEEAKALVERVVLTWLKKAGVETPAE